jgi:integrase
MEEIIGIKSSTQANYNIAVNSFFSFLNVEDPIEFLRTKQPAEIVNLLDTWIMGLNVKEYTKVTKLSSTRSMIQNALNISLPKQKVSRLLSKYIPRKSTKELLTKEEVDKLRKHFLDKAKQAQSDSSKVINMKNYLLVALLAGTGQRIQDILNLTCEQAKKPFIHFKQQKTGMEGFIENPCLGEILAYIQLSGLNDSDYLFAVGFLRKPMSRTMAYGIISKAALLVLQKERIGPHCFRKYVANRLADIGESDRSIQAVTLHGSRSMVEYYQKNADAPNNLKEKL